MNPLLFLVNLNSTEVNNVDGLANFNKNTAQLMEKGQWSVGVFSPLRYGLKDDIELEVHPGWALLAPHIGVKNRKGSLKNWQISRKYSISYPTPLLKKLASPGIGGILAADSTIPQIISAGNDNYLTRSFEKAGSLTLAVGAHFAYSFGDSNYTTIDAPYGFRLTNLYQNGISVNIGLGWEYFITQKLGFRIWSQSYLFPASEQKWMVEERDTFLYQVSERSQLSAGVNMAVGEYPYGTNWHVLPSVDWAWSF